MDDIDRIVKWQLGRQDLDDTWTRAIFEFIESGVDSLQGAARWQPCYGWGAVYCDGSYMQEEEFDRPPATGTINDVTGIDI